MDFYQVTCGVTVNITAQYGELGLATKNSQVRGYSSFRVSHFPLLIINRAFYFEVSLPKVLVCSTVSNYRMLL